MANLLFGYFAVFLVVFLTYLAFADPEYGVTSATNFLVGFMTLVLFWTATLVAFGVLNGLIRLLNRDQSRRAFWWTAVGNCIAGTAGAYVAWHLRLV